MSDHGLSRVSSLMRGRQVGVVAVEFALAATVFFMVVASIFDFGYLFWVQLTMQHAVREGARIAVVGSTALTPNPNPANAMQNRYTTAIAEMTAQSMGLWASVSPVVSVQTVDATGALTTLPTGNLGAASQIVVISVDCSTPLIIGFIRPFFAGGVHTFRVSAAMRNEEFT